MRTWTAVDATALGTAITESLDDLLPWMPWAAGEPVAIADRKALIEQWRETWRGGGDLVLGIFDESRTVVGGTGLHRRLGPGALEIGYWVHSAHTGRGYATEVSSALTDLAFTVPGIERVEIHHDRANVASGRVPAKLGFTMVGELPRDITAPSECGITCTWRVTRDEWPELRGVSRTS